MAEPQKEKSLFPQSSSIPIRALAFDAYGTLFDVHSVMSKLKEFYPGQAEDLSQLWRSKQLEYTWLLSLMGHYRDFWQVTTILKYTCPSLKLPLEPTTIEQLLEAYLHLSAYPEVGTALEGLAAFPRVILSNGTPKMLELRWWPTPACKTLFPGLSVWTK